MSFSFGGGSSSAAGGVSEDARKFFVDDDDETLSMLVSSDDNKPSLDTLKSLGKRFQADRELDNTASWDDWTGTVQSMGFRVSYSQSSFRPNASNADVSQLPAALESEEGKLHLDATSSILSVSKLEAVQLTLAAMRSMSMSGQFQSLLGTRALLEKVTEYYYKQRLARLSVIAECLRAEQDDSNTDYKNILDSLDASRNDGNQDRGLFCMLLTTACQVEPMLKWEHFLPAEKLRSSLNQNSKSITNTSFGGQDDSSERILWKQFMRETIRRKRICTQSERLEALEGLVSLFYSRIAGGVSRIDLAMLLVAFQSQTFFLKESEEIESKEINQRLARLSGLICVETMALWRIFGTGDWVASHPLFQLDGQVESELQKLRGIIDTNCNALTIHGEVPPSLALLAFGLLLHAAGTDNDRWKVLSNDGLKIAKHANSAFDSYGYLYMIMENLVVPMNISDDIKRSFGDRQQLPYDMLAFEESRLELTYEDDSAADTELSAPSLAYANIGCELLSATIYSFQSKLLPAQQPPDSHSMQMLANIISVIFRNSPTLCERFWDDWNIYLKSNSSSPLCALLNGAFKLANAALQQYKSDENALISVTPLLQIVASLAYTAEIAEAEIKTVLPNGLLRRALFILISKAASPSHSDLYSNCSGIILDSICTLARVGNSPSCREVLRAAMEEGDQDVVGPRNLMTLVTKLPSDDTKSMTKIFTLVSDLIVDAPQPWAFDVIRGLKIIQDSGNFWNSLFNRSNASTQALVKVINGLVNHMSKLIFSPGVNESIAVEILEAIQYGVQSCGTVLAASSSRVAGGKPLTYRSAALILDVLNNTLCYLKPIMDLHPSKLVRQSAEVFRDNLIGTLATRQGLGETVFSFAIAPVTLNLAHNLESVARDSTLLLVSGNENNDDKSTSVLSVFAQQAPSVDSNRLRPLLTSELANLDCLEFDFESIRARGWLDSEDDTDGPLFAALNSLRLLNSWAISVEAQVGEDSSNESIGEALFSSPYKFLALAAHWPQDIHSDIIPGRFWATAEISNFSLLIRYMAQNAQDDVGIESILTMEFLDFLSNCLAHGKTSMNIRGAGGMDESFFRIIYRSTSFIKATSNCFQSTLSNKIEDRLSPLNKVNTSIGLRCLRLLAALTDANAALSAKMIFNSDCVLQTLVDCVKDAASALGKIRRESLFSKQPPLHLIYQLRIGAGCLNVLRLIWRHARSKSNSAQGCDFEISQKPIQKHSSLVADIAMLVFSNAEILSLPPRSNLISQRCLCVVRNISTLALDLLTLELNWSRAQSKITSDFPIVGALEKGLGSNLSSIIDATKYFTMTSSFELYAGAYKEFTSKSSIMDQEAFQKIESILNIFSVSSNFVERDFFVDSNGRDGARVSRWLCGLERDRLSSTESEGLLSNLDVTFNSISNETRCLGSWKSFLQSLYWFQKRWREDGSTSGILSMPEGSFCAMVMIQILESIYGNLDIVESMEFSEFPLLLKEEALSLTLVLTGLLLTFGQNTSLQMTNDQWIKSMSLVCKIGERIPRFDIVDRLKICSVLKQVLVVSVLLARFKPEQLEPLQILESEKIFLDLASRASQVIRTIEQLGSGMEDYATCYCTCVAVLSSVIQNATLGKDTEKVFLSKVCQILKDLHIIRSLVHQASARSSNPNVGTELNNRSKESIDESLILLVTLDLLSKLALSGNQDVLSLLGNNEASHILWTMQSETSADQSGISNKMVSGETVSDQQQAPSQISRVLKAKMKFVEACLRSSNQSDYMSSQVATLFIGVAVDFVRANKTVFIECLERCSNFLDATDSDQHILTLRTLKEATSFLSIISELCTRKALDVFKRECPGLMKTLIGLSRSITVSLGSFLGASGASREIFRAMDDFTSADTGDIEEEYSMPNSAQRLLAGGLQNAKHEAIRYSYFVTKVSQRPFTGTYGQNIGNSPSVGSKSMSSLENACRSAVTNNFALMEIQAAKCLFNSLSILWKTHPSSYSFVSYSEEEAACLDSMRLVRPGMVIGFRKRNRSKNSSLALYGSEDDGTEPVCFGQVLDCDTVRRQWHVEMQGKEGGQYIVQDSHLAGIEDLTKRVCTLAHCPAPDSSSNLENFGRSASLGHLILTIRWCSQIYSETCRQTPLAMDVAPVLRLAELAAALVGTELSIREENRMRKRMARSEVDKIIASQLFDLFGDHSDLEKKLTRFANVTSQFDGRLKSIFSATTWNAIRKQVKMYLHEAIDDIDGRLLATNRPNTENSLFLRKNTM